MDNSPLDYVQTKYIGLTLWLENLTFNFKLLILQYMYTLTLALGRLLNILNIWATGKYFRICEGIIKRYCGLDKSSSNIQDVLSKSVSSVFIELSFCSKIHFLCTKDASDGDHPRKIMSHSLELEFSNKEDILNN